MPTVLSRDLAHVLRISLYVVSRCGHFQVHHIVVHITMIRSRMVCLLLRSPCKIGLQFFNVRFGMCDFSVSRQLWVHVHSSWADGMLLSTLLCHPAPPLFWHGFFFGGCICLNAHLLLLFLLPSHVAFTCSRRGSPRAIFLRPPMSLLQLVCLCLQFGSPPYCARFSHFNVKCVTYISKPPCEVPFIDKAPAFRANLQPAMCRFP